MAETVRRLVHEADPDVEEVIKRRTQPYFVLDGNICALLGTKNHLNVFIYDPIAPDPHGLINQGQGNATARGIQVRPGDEVGEAALVELFRAVIANNRAGGWRRGPATGVARADRHFPHHAVRPARACSLADEGAPRQA